MNFLVLVNFEIKSNFEKEKLKFSKNKKPIEKSSKAICKKIKITQNKFLLSIFNWVYRFLTCSRAPRSIFC